MQSTCCAHEGSIGNHGWQACLQEKSALLCRGHKRQAAASRSSLKLHQYYWHIGWGSEGIQVWDWDEEAV